MRRVRCNGAINWLGGRVFLSEALIGEPVGITETDDELHTVHYGPVFLGYRDRTGSFCPSVAGKPKKQQPPEENV